MRDKIETKCRMYRLEIPLKTRLMPSYIVAHQNFAVRLLKWLTTLFGRCSGFRALFAEVFFSVGCLPSCCNYNQI